MESLILVMTLCSFTTGRCEVDIIDQHLTIEDCNKYRIETLIAHSEGEKKGVYGGYIQSLDCTIEDKE